MFYDNSAFKTDERTAWLEGLGDPRWRGLLTGDGHAVGANGERAGNEGTGSARFSGGHAREAAIVFEEGLHAASKMIYEVAGCIDLPQMAAAPDRDDNHTFDPIAARAFSPRRQRRVHAHSHARSDIRSSIRTGRRAAGCWAGELRRVPPRTGSRTQPTGDGAHCSSGRANRHLA
jgi:hypothetical protein